MATVINGTAYWAHITRPNTMFDDAGTWSIDVGNLSDDVKAQVEEDGLTIKNKGDERGDFVTIKRNVQSKKGEQNSAPTVKDAQNKTVLNTLVGNGSIVNVQYQPYEWTFQKKSGVSADLRAVQIVDLVPYEEEGEGFGVVEGGYTSNDADSDAPFAVN